MNTPRTFRSMESLDQESLPMRLWHKAKKLGTWDPQAIDFEQDIEDWQQLDDLEQEVLLHLTSQFLAGEESVTNDLLPLIMTVADEGRLEEEMYLTSFLFEEAKHVEVFRRFFDEVAPDHGDLSRFQGESYRKIFDEALPEALNRLRQEQTPVAQAEASATYNMIVEGVLAETGYHAYFSTLEANDMMPGMQKVARLLKQDESRHMAYGVHLLSRLVDEHGQEVWEAIETRMHTLLPVAIGIVEEVFDSYEVMPLGLELDNFVSFATEQFQNRYSRIAPSE